MAGSAVRIFLKVLIVAILAGWACVWVLKPTKVWKKSWHSAEDAARETFLGVSGINVVVFCYPVLSVAMLGYAYMHLLSAEKRIRWQNSLVIRKLVNPVVVHSPVGILTGTELLAGAIFAALLLWTLYRNVSSDFRKLVPPKSLNLDRQQLRILRVGIRFGSLAEICLAVLLLPILRGMALFKVFRLQFETSVRYHIWVANVMILVAAIHGITITSVWAAKNSFWTEIIKWQATGRVNLAGAITLITGVAIWITSLPPVRRHNFQFFFSSHHLYIVFLVFFLFHGGDRHFYLVFSGVLLLALDKVLRTIQSRPTPCLVSARLLPCRAVELTLSKHPSLRHTPTSMIFIKVPSISKLHWHPFSITSSSAAISGTMSITIKCHGWWTNTLYGNLQSMLSLGDSLKKSFLVAMEGPYGPTTNFFQSYDSLVLIAGGSGVTPLLSILEEVASWKSSTTAQPQRIRLIYAVKKSEDLTMLMPISHLLLKRSHSPLNFKLQAFVTQEKQLRATSLRETLLHEASRAEVIHFDPKTPIQVAPRTVSLLWRAAVAALASVVFLVVLAGLSRAFLPAGKKGTETKNPSWINDLLVIIAFSVAASCAAFVTIIWRRRARKDCTLAPKEQGKYKDSQIEDVAGGVEEHELHAGRPDIQGLLTEISLQWRKSEEVGVYVCGPDTMQSTVASFCRRCSKANVDFHPLNFCL